MSSNCFSVLRSYADFLSHNGSTVHDDIKTVGYRPHPIFFSQTNCEGAMYPPNDVDLWKDTVTTIPFSTNMYENVGFGEVFDPVTFSIAPDITRLESFYIPAFWKVVFTMITPGTKERTTRTFEAIDSPVLITDTSGLKYDSGNSEWTFKYVSSISMQSLKPFTAVPYTFRCWKADMCNERIRTSIGGDFLESWLPGSVECDGFMTTWCESNEGYGCVEGGSTDYSKNLNDITCSCLKEEEENLSKFCQPGSSLSITEPCINYQKTTDNNPPPLQTVPVSCFGKQCSEGGYHFGRMDDQRCGVTLCHQIFDVVGENVRINFDNSIYCGTQPTTTPTDPLTIYNTKESVDSSTAKAPTTIQTWEWALIAVAVLLTFVVIPLSIVVFRRASKHEKQDALWKKKKISEDVEIYKKDYLKGQ
jgi:hypothetical protein